MSSEPRIGNAELRKTLLYPAISIGQLKIASEYNILTSYSHEGGMRVRLFPYIFTAELVLL